MNKYFVSWRSSTKSGNCFMNGDELTQGTIQNWIAWIKEFNKTKDDVLITFMIKVKN